MDLQSGYHQVEMHKDDRHKTAFITADGLQKATKVKLVETAEISVQQ